MLTTFTLQVAVGGGFRLALAWGLRRHYDLRLTAPDALAVILLVLAGLPGWLSPIPFPLPFSFTLGAVLPDLLTRRVST
ncbi:hypothetical protein [Tropicibacter sp. Alg240-R139]|uniref:hypothetical protein n=1 Tax=Tropicibacter sp. Alg240-R139 TaxID=2305991 RepID=UPI0013DFE748|nr:hypothetical protein [Tropicibacter sp. Alg240-R139]